MGYWDSLIQTNSFRQPARPTEDVNAYAAIFPIYEQQTPQYPTPNPWNLEQISYLANEIAFACIQKRVDAVSEPPMLIYDGSGKTAEEIDDHPMRKILENPCMEVTESMFWQINEIHMGTAGFSIWEKERNRLGEVIHLWPMRPDWCSFYRGNGRPTDRVRYQPYGLPPMDIIRENLVLFRYFNPQYPLLKPTSPAMVAMRSIGVDNSATDYLKLFFERGSVVNGILSTDQSLSDAEATRIKDRWKDTHGGVENWTDIAVTGKGTKYQPIGMNFDQMAFDQLDGRSEARICAVYKVPPILINAKVGLSASTYSNYEQARKAFYEETISPQWKYYQDELRVQLLPDFEKDYQAKKIYTGFDTSDVRALQENKDAVWKRAIEAAAKNIITRDESREEIGLDPIDDAPVFVGMTVRAMDAASIGPGGAPEAPVTEIAGNQPQDAAAAGDPTQPVPGQVPPQQQPPQQTPPAPLQQKQPVQPAKDSEEKQAAKALERKQFTEFAQKRIKEGHIAKARQYKFKHLSAGEQAALMTQVLPMWRGYP